MEKNENMLADAGMKFFGKMTASATHEIKNALAIINESAGLLEDLSIMASKDHPLSPIRIKDISQMVTRHVQRSDLILKKINRLSHSFDLSTQSADLEKTVCFILDLASRLVEMQGVTVEVTSPISPITVNTNLFYLKNMIWRAIETACLANKGKNRVMVSFGTDPFAPSIWFSMDTVKNDLLDDLFGSKEDQALAAHLDISIENNNNNNGFGLLWPKRI